MNFFSFEFLASFTAFFLIYWLCQKAPFTEYPFNYGELSVCLLIRASFAYVLAGYTLFIYLLTNVLSSRLSARAVYSLLAAGIIGCFTVFKYYGFMQESLQSALLQAGVEVELPVLSVLAPLGLSFYAFHSVSYVVSVCRKEIEKPLLDVVLYLCFFPSIVAGPINRAKAFMPQVQAASREIIDYKSPAADHPAMVKLFYSVLICQKTLPTRSSVRRSTTAPVRFWWRCTPMPEYLF